MLVSLLNLLTNWDIQVYSVVAYSSHDRFRRCVAREVRRMCDRGVPNGRAVKFAEQIIDKALSFLQDQCLNYM